MIIRFEKFGIACIGEYDKEGETLMFDFEDYEVAEQQNSSENIDEVREWFRRNHINCYSEKQANDHLDYLGIKQRFR